MVTLGWRRCAELERIALISDIHGNPVALDAVLEDIESSGADRTVCLGDVSATGPAPLYTLKTLRSRDITIVMGNTDERIMRPEAGKFNSSRDREIEKVDVWCSSLLGEQERKFISSFSPVISEDTEAGGILYYHGSPRSSTEVIDSSSSEEFLGEVFSSSDADICAGGHTHVQMLRRFGHMTLINPGSVGLPYRVGRNGRHFRPVIAEYAIMELRKGEFTVDFRKVGYDISELKEAVESSGMPEASWWLSKWKTE
ncbi:MAG: metallophosphoesterase family protein [Candidatus Thermoplasmatota archaeon]|uniref:Metallophosphoesterase family protein n=1 Tax=Candidatus Sysuiplasma superficiale TaxID=2823368 RepID=A0A8J7YMT5_9ARCH|nr:metallophosphoesterase family protein [Candidatus Sysuiplasma superficiale]MCL4346528.1 metallophosphoesterase family protein [Candidatus Thermoplasmatota archaeon]